MDKQEYFGSLDDAEVKTSKLLAKMETAIHKLLGYCDDLDALVEFLRVEASNTEFDKEEARKVGTVLDKIRKESEVLRRGLNHYEKL